MKFFVFPVYVIVCLIFPAMSNAVAAKGGAAEPATRPEGQLTRALNINERVTLKSRYDNANSSFLRVASDESGSSSDSESKESSEPHKEVPVDEPDEPGNSGSKRFAPPMRDEVPPDEPDKPGGGKIRESN